MSIIPNLCEKALKTVKKSLAENLDKRKNYLNHKHCQDEGGMEKKIIDRTTSAAEQLRFELQTALKGIREEFDEHLEDINANTEEIQSNYEYLQRLDIKLDQLAEKFESMQQWIARNTGMPFDEEPDETILLTKEEKEIFFAIFAATQKVTYKQLAQQMKISDFLVRSYITNLIEKGIPIVKSYEKNIPYLHLEPRFKEKQQRYNILQISQKQMKDF